LAKIASGDCTSLLVEEPVEDDPDVEDEEDVEDDPEGAEVPLSEVLEEADAAASDPDEVPLEEPTTSLESVDAVSQAASNIVAAQIVNRRFIMEVPIQIISKFVCFCFTFKYASLLKCPINIPWHHLLSSLSL